MENKQLFETLKAGLGNGLKMQRLYRPHHEQNKVHIATEELTGIRRDQYGDWIIQTHGVFEESYNSTSIKPHLLPLSMLTKPIKVVGYNDGKEFSPIHEVEKINPKTTVSYPCVVMEDGSIEMDHWAEFDLLFQWHFNVFNLDETQYINAAESKVYENN